MNRLVAVISSSASFSERLDSGRAFVAGLPSSSVLTWLAKLGMMADWAL